MTYEHVLPGTAAVRSTRDDRPEEAYTPISSNTKTARGQHARFSSLLLDKGRGCDDMTIGGTAAGVEEGAPKLSSRRAREELGYFEAT